MKAPIKYGPYGRYVEVYGIESESRPGLIYTVARTAEDKWSCGCPRWTRNASRPECKHIAFIKKVRVRSNTQIDLTPVSPMPEKVRKQLSTFAAIEV